MRELRVYVGMGLDEAGIKEALNVKDNEGNTNSLLFELAQTILPFEDSLTEINGVTVTDVSFNGEFRNQVTIEFETYWSIYRGCDDMNQDDTEYECESATYTSDGHLIFIVSPPKKELNYC